MASSLLAASAAKRRLPLLMSFYGRLRPSNCSLGCRERELKVGLARKINGAPPEDLERRCRQLMPGIDIHAPRIISESKCYIESATGQSQPLPAQPKLQSRSSLNLNANANPDIVMHSFDKDEFSLYFTIYSVDQEEGSLSPKYYIYPPSSIKKAYFSGGTCNGLFHLLNTDSSKHFLWNPATDAIKSLPVIDVPRPPVGTELLKSVMWYDHNRPNYKLLQPVWAEETVQEEGECTGEDNRLFCLWLYSLDRNSWKKILCPGVWPRPSTSACIDGVYYHKAFTDGASVILSFDFSAETYSILPLPLTDDGDYLCYCILDYKGLLSIMAYSFEGLAPIKFQLWVRKGQDWTRESVFHVSGVQHPYWFSKDGRLVYFEDVNHEILVFDRALGISKNLGIHRHSTLPEFYPFVETSVQLDGCD